MAKAVLIADDNAYIRHTLCELLRSQGDFDICGEAENGKEAVEKAQELDPDLIVLDLSMPVMNGLDAARALKRTMPGVPLIMFSEYSSAFSEQEAHSVGISALVSKSEHISVLVETARSLLTARLLDYLFSQSGNPKLSAFSVRKLARASSIA